MGKSGKKFAAAKAKVEPRPTRWPRRSSSSARCKYAKFDESVDIAMLLGVDPKHADQMVRGTVVLPHGTGKSKRVAVIAGGDKVKEAEEAGADHVGAEDLVEKIQGGFLDFEALVATPDMMRLVGKLGKVLGPQGPDAEPEGRHRHDGRRQGGQARSRAARSSSASTRPRSSTPRSARSRSTRRSSRRTRRRSSGPCRGPSPPRPRASTSGPSPSPRRWGPGVEIDTASIEAL